MDEITPLGLDNQTRFFYGSRTHARTWSVPYKVPEIKRPIEKITRGREEKGKGIVPG